MPGLTGMPKGDYKRWLSAGSWAPTVTARWVLPGFLQHPSGPPSVFHSTWQGWGVPALHPNRLTESIEPSKPKWHTNTSCPPFLRLPARHHDIEAHLFLSVNCCSQIIQILDFYWQVCFDMDKIIKGHSLRLPLHRENWEGPLGLSYFITTCRLSPLWIKYTIR